MLVLAWASAAWGADLVIQLSGPGVQVQVDGSYLDTLSGTVTAHDLEAGSHTVRIVDMLSKPLVTQEVVVAADDYVVLKYKSRTLTEVNRSSSSDDGKSTTAAPTANFDLLLEHVKNSETVGGELDLIRFGAAMWTFSCTQTVTLMGTFDKDTDKLEVVKILKPRLVDPDRHEVIEAATPATVRSQVAAMFD
jgi:hypothetical protein